MEQVKKPPPANATRSVAEADRRRTERYYVGIPNLYEEIDQLREQGPVVRGDLQQLLGFPPLPPIPGTDPETFVVLGYDACAEAFRRNDELSSSVANGVVDRPTLTTMDEPAHRRYRSLVQPAFALKTLEAWEHRWLAPTLDELNRELPAKGRVDLYNKYCSRFPARTITGGFGIPPSDAEQVHLWVLHVTGGGTPEQAADAAKQFDAYMLQVIDARRAAGTEDDVIGLLVGSTLEEGNETHHLSDDEILSFARLMITAGSGTTYRTAGFVLLQLAKNPDWYMRIRANRDELVPVIEETLRWSPPVSYFWRVATTDFELAGVEIPKGSIVQICVGAANRDPERWENPHVWDPSRTITPHITFGYGPHFCIGHQLARAELRIAVGRLVERYEAIELADDVPPPEIDGVMLRSIPALEVMVR